MPDGLIMVVDDDLDIAEALALVLEGEGYRVVTATDGGAALSRLRSGPRPSLILLDLMMPQMNGWLFREQQLADPAISSIPVVVLSGNHAALRAAPPPGVATCLQKPLDLNTLLDVVARHAIAQPDHRV